MTPEQEEQRRLKAIVRERNRRADPEKSIALRERERDRSRLRRATETHKAYSRDYMRRYRAAHPEYRVQALKLRREWIKNNPGKESGYHRKYTYGTTPEQWDARFAAQNNFCAICLSDDPRGKKGWQLDHCHDSGKVRGILCMDCNRIVHGRITVEILRAAAAYLESFTITHS